ncbi:hypothetical protein [Listeria ivanovii]|uniref:hypothetical protein n=1 Tax=Listeria ivanovii TaxID=1638 RepID=UPI0019444E77|nr:hypothetical protein [Listeria ivanovii]MBM5707765.1 hypothetical protein [Listeria ivanovii]
MILAYLKRIFSSEIGVSILSLTGFTVILVGVLWLIDKIPNIEKVLTIIGYILLWTFFGTMAIGLIGSLILLVCDFVKFRRNYKESKKAGGALEQ